MGDEKIIEKAVEVGSKALNRKCNLKEKLCMAGEASKQGVEVFKCNF